VGREDAIAIGRAYTGVAPVYAQINDDRSFAEPLLGRLAERLPAGAIVADLGCGPGWETEALTRRGFRAVGVDLTADFLRYAAGAHPAAGYVAGDFLALPFASSMLDGVWACSSLVHVPWRDIDAALAEVARVLRPGGAFFASMQAGRVEGPLASRTFPDKTFHYAYYEPDEWRTRLVRAGFEVGWFNTHDEPPEHCNPGAHGWIESLALRS
jgi:ubiquinone/menaquinone biosynthesis C-methylase UbiE